MNLTKWIISRNCQNFLINGYQNCIIPQLCNFNQDKTFIVTLSPNLSKSFAVSLSLAKKKNEAKSKETDNKFRAPEKKLTEGPRVTVYELEKESTMYFSELQKYAKRKNLMIVKLESNPHEKPKYKVEEITNVFENISTKKNQNLKKLMLKDVINDNDLQVKIKSMLKFLEKGKQVSCVITCDSDKDRLTEIFNIIRETKLVEHLTQNKKSEKKLQLLFNPKTKESDEKTDEKSEENSEDQQQKLC